MAKCPLRGHPSPRASRETFRLYKIKFILQIHYKKLIDRCTDEFASKHLALNYQMRRRLLNLCNYELGDKQECYVHVTLQDDLNEVI